jgi:hypothetical protein
LYVTACVVTIVTYRKKTSFSKLKLGAEMVKVRKSDSSLVGLTDWIKNNTYIQGSGQAQ